MERKNKSVGETNKPTKKFVIFKRCSRAGLRVHLPQIDQRLQYTSFTDGLGLKLCPGDIVNTTKYNQLLIVHTSDCDPTSIFDIEKSSFVVGYILAQKDNTLEYLDNIKVPQRVIAGAKCYVINKRKFSYIDIKDAVRVLNCDEGLGDKIKMEEVDGSLYIPTYFYNLLGSLKSDLFDELIEN